MSRSFLIIAAALAAGFFTIPAPALADAPVHEVKIATADPDVVLAGDLVLPKTNPAQLAVLLVAGTGDHPRDMVISGTPIFRLLAERLAEQGIASLRVDARGTAESTGPSTFASTTGDRIEDTRAALAWLRANEHARFENVVLLGHSEGAAIGAALAAGDQPPDGLILLGAPARRGMEVWVDQQLAGVRGAVEGGDSAVISEIEKRLNLAAELSVKGVPAEEMVANTRRLFELAGMDIDSEAGKEMLDGFVGRMSDPWMRYFLDHDPEVNFARTRAPLLAIYGSHDQQTSPALNAPRLVAALVEAGNNNFTMRILPEQDHFFLRLPGQPVGEHKFGEMELSAELLDESVTWLRNNYMN